MNKDCEDLFTKNEYGLKFTEADEKKLANVLFEYIIGDNVSKENIPQICRGIVRLFPQLKTTNTETDGIVSIF